MSKLGAEVWATDLEPNLPLLKDNFAANGKSCVYPWAHSILWHWLGLSITAAVTTAYAHLLAGPLQQTL